MRKSVVLIVALVVVALTMVIALSRGDAVHGQGDETATPTPVGVVYAPLVLRGELLITPTPTSTPRPTFDPAQTTARLEPLVGGLDDPIGIENAADGSGRLFVIEKVGRIRIVRNGALVGRPFLDITSRVLSSGFEQGLLGLAFDPGYRDNGRFYVNYIDLNGNTVIARYQVSNDPDFVNPATEAILLGVDQPFPNHNGGQLAFGPDRYLYVGLGDGGSGGDPQGNGQNTNTLLGKILRLDVSGGAGYTIPVGNPFAGQAGKRAEIWAYGLRNPWRFAFDRLTGDLYIGDVGQGQWEEVNFQPVGAAGGVNYGWSAMEGAHCYPSGSSCNPTLYTLPVAEYGHSEGCSVTGGYVYRGSAQAALYGAYFFGDFCNGQLWALQRGSGGAWQLTKLTRANTTLSSFGEDESGEVYAAGYDSGVIYRLVAAARS